MQPFEQGALDSLCGIYSIVNAERMVNNTSEKSSEALFAEIVGYLDEKEMLGTILTKGMRLKLIKEIMSDVVGKRLPLVETPFAGVANPELDEFWTEMVSFLSGGEKRAILLGLAGVHDHWTVIHKITDQQIELLDSGGIVHLKRANCTTAGQKGGRYHILCPAQTVFIGRG